MARVLFFGRFSDVATAWEGALPDGVQTTDELSRYLSDENDRLADLMGQPGMRIAVNRQVITGNTEITDDDEIAYLSALSGG